MIWSDIPWSPSSRTLRQFAGLWLLFVGGLACWHGWHGETAAAVSLALLAGGVGTLGLVVPQAIRPLFVGWMVAAFPIGWTVSYVLMALLFYAVFTPLGLAFRLTGRDALGLRRRPEAPSYWQPKTAANVQQYFRQF
jgi:hypothetical protein